MSSSLYGNWKYEVLDGMSVTTLETQDVPRPLWRAVQGAQYDQVTRQIEHRLPAHLSPEDRAAQLARAAIITDFGDAGTYADKRCRLNAYKNQGGDETDQDYWDPRLTAVFGRNKRLAACVLTVMNASPILPGSLGTADQLAKMHSPALVTIPGRHRSVQIRDLVITDEPGAAVAAVAHALGGYDSGEIVSAYRMLAEDSGDRSDPADAEMGWFVDISGINPKGVPKYITGLPGYPPRARLQRYEGAAGTITEWFLSLGKAAISDMDVLSAAPDMYYRD